MGVFSNISNSLLIDVLERKLEERGDQYNDLCIEVAKFIKFVPQELQQINTLFPEYTPHNEDYHIANLFRIADIIFNEEKYYKMNIIELLLLIVSMYAHDWGMAVSKTERNAIAIHDNSQLNLLDNEFEYFDAFVAKKYGNIKVEKENEIPLEIWQEYIRESHALRSAKRVENYFKNFSSSFAEAAGKICMGHWLEINEISDKNRYYKDSSVCGETINLRALTIYIRLIDLFDLGEDRTPYVLWKYVNPQNEFSKMEWKKHRALHPITCPPYENGRTICISGSTDDHRVYAALIDFKKTCDKYFRECSDSLAYMNDDRHKLDVCFLDWRIEARNFKPISIAFDFERERIFKVISDEIYNCHPYVFLRELIQNSIDAISFRQNVLERKLIGGDNIGYLYITVEKKEDNFEITFSDDGIGMDEYILRNYFSVLGRSYYTSSDFKNKQLDMVPISKFGVGILSCFSISKQMEILTKREPYIDEGKTGLKIIIEDISKTFRIEECFDSKCEVGTTIKLKIKEKDFYEQLEKNKIDYSDFNITSYIKNITSFVKYPIIINEMGEKTIIFSNENQINKIKRRINSLSEYRLHKSTIQYPVEKIVKSQDVKNFEKIFEFKSFDVSKDLGMNEVEGEIIFAVLKDYQTEIKNLSSSWPPSEVFAYNSDNEYRLRWYKDFWFYFKNESFSTGNECFAVYNKGILLEKQNFNWFEKCNFNHIGLFPIPYVKINLKNTVSDISISRFESESISKIIKSALKKIENLMLEELYCKLKSLEKYDLWKAFTVSMLQYHIKIKKIKLDDVMLNSICYPFIDEEGKIVYESISEKEMFLTIPAREQEIVFKYFENPEDFNIEKWNYGKCALMVNNFPHIEGSISSLIGSTINEVLAHYFYLYEIKFVNNNYSYPIVQEIWKKGSTNKFLEEVKEILCQQTTIATIESIEAFCESYTFKDKYIGFFNEHEGYMLYGCNKINLKHHKAQQLILYSWLLYELKNGDEKDEDVSVYIDKFEELPFINERILTFDREYHFSEMNKNLYDLYSWLKNKFQNKASVDVVSISEVDFIPGSIKHKGKDTFVKCPGVE